MKELIITHIHLGMNQEYLYKNIELDNIFFSLYVNLQNF